MSKSNFVNDILQDQIATDDERSAQRSTTEIPSKSNRDRDSVTPFAKDMVENVVNGALSILDISRREGKSWKDVLAASKNPPEEFSGQDITSGNRPVNSISLSDPQQPAVVQVMHLRVRDDVVFDSVHADQVAKIVKGLQDIQIGDSAYVLPTNGSNIEKQVKRAVRNINSLEFGDMETAQLIICDGQGDVDAAILEAAVGPPNTANSKPQHDASKVSTCFLHKMIEELEDGDSTKINLPEHGNNEGIASWEESEEKFIRIIEGLGDERDPAAFLEHQEYHDAVIFDTGIQSNFKDVSSEIHQAFKNGEEIDDQENARRPRNLLDNYIDEEPYWCTAGLITRVVMPQHGDACLSNATTMAGDESRVSELNENIVIEKTEDPSQGALSFVEQAEDKSEAKDDKSKLKSGKKTSFGKRLRKFFLRFKRTRNC